MMDGDHRSKYHFVTYHPFATFAEANPKRQFRVGMTGRPFEMIRGGRETPDSSALFQLGMRAYRLLPNYATKEEFDSEVLGFDAFVEEGRQTLYSLVKSGKSKAVSSENGSELAGDVILDIEDSEVLLATWGLSKKAMTAPDEQVHDVFLGAFCISCLIDIDSANLGRMDPGAHAVAYALSAAEAFFNAEAIASRDIRLQQARKQIALQGALSRLQKDPRQAEKQFIYKCWLDWQAAPTRYASKAAFARDMITKCQHLQSTKKIEDWARGWEADSRP
jgi:hypothetical protein